MTTQQTAFEFALPAAMAGADFIISDCNREAVAWMGNFENWELPALVIYGAPSSGKSHLCRIWQDMHEATVLTQDDLSSDQNVVDSVKAGGVYVIDDVDTIIEKHPQTQEGLFHAYNILLNDGGLLLLTASKAPKDMVVTLPDLLSRLRAVPAVEITDPDDETLQALLMKLFDDRQVQIKPDVIKFLCPRLERSYPAIHKAVEGIDQFSLQGKRAITVPLVREWLDKA